MTKRHPKRRDPESTQFAKNQRATANEFAQGIWQFVRVRRCCGEKFRREYVIGPYTADFCCVTLKLIIEVDGEHHFTATGQSRDRVRDRYLAELGFEVLRIPGYEYLRDPKSVRDQIVAAILSRRDS